MPCNAREYRRPITAPMISERHWESRVSSQMQQEQSVPHNLAMHHRRHVWEIIQYYMAKDTHNPYQYHTRWTTHVLWDDDPLIIKRCAVGENLRINATGKLERDIWPTSVGQEHSTIEKGSMRECLLTILINSWRQICAKSRTLRAHNIIEDMRDK